MYVFVYGTLMSGLYNHSHMKGMKLIGAGKTKNKYGLHIMISIPFMHDDEDLYQIEGEVYEVDEKQLEKLDKIESEGRWYHRKKTVVVVGDTDYECFAYFCNQKSAKIPHGSYRKYAEEKLK
jgi:gamma-glutamylcyclotransferase (GGCT)/AIG2-like uncharacterized protein YtfP